jgi:UDP-N-acetyl-D-glucosamine dehydrogenase
VAVTFAEAGFAYHDPYVPEILIGEEGVESAALDAELLRRADCVVIATAHDCYDWRWVLERSRLVFDTRNAARAAIPAGAHVIRL